MSNRTNELFERVPLEANWVIEHPGYDEGVTYDGREECVRCLVDTGYFVDTFDLSGAVDWTLKMDSPETRKKAEALIEEQIDLKIGLRQWELVIAESKGIPVGSLCCPNGDTYGTAQTFLDTLGCEATHFYVGSDVEFKPNCTPENVDVVPNRHFDRGAGCDQMIFEGKLQGNRKYQHCGLLVRKGEGNYGPKRVCYVRQSLVLFEDTNMYKQRRAGKYGYTEVGLVSLESQAIRVFW